MILPVFPTCRLLYLADLGNTPYLTELCLTSCFFLFLWNLCSLAFRDTLCCFYPTLFRHGLVHSLGHRSCPARLVWGERLAGPF